MDGRGSGQNGMSLRQWMEAPPAFDEVESVQLGMSDMRLKDGIVVHEGWHLDDAGRRVDYFDVKLVEDVELFCSGLLADLLNPDE